MRIRKEVGMRLTLILVAVAASLGSAEAIPTAGQPLSSNAAGSDYFASESSLGLYRWNAMPIRVYIEAGADVPGYKPEYIDIFKRAAAEWEQASNGKVVFKYVTSPTSAQITVKFTDSHRDLGNLEESGATLVLPDPAGSINGRPTAIMNATIALLTKHSTGEDMSSAYAHKLDLHEIGHAIGLRVHSSNPEDVMFVSKDRVSEANITERDKKTLQKLYSADITNSSSPKVESADLEPVAGDTALNRSIKLCNQANALANANNIPAAILKLEEARKISPELQLVNANLGITYGNLAFEAKKTGDFDRADKYFNLALPLLRKAPQLGHLKNYLGSYSRMLHGQKRDAEAAPIDAELANQHLY